MAGTEKKAKRRSKFGTKALVLGILVFQNSSLILFMRYTRANHEDKAYAASTAVLMSEILKSLISFLTFCQVQGYHVAEAFWTIEKFMVNYPLEMVKIAVPSALYTVQNYLQYVAVTNLDGPTFQLMSQLKILTTACFSVGLLNKRLTKQQWFALVILVAGVCCVQSSSSEGAASGRDKRIKSNLVGLIAVLVACSTSGFAGVYFEKVLKGSDISLWMRNIQMAFLGVLLGIVSVAYNDYYSVKVQGFFYGYNWKVWLVIFLQAGGGLLVSLVVKYADNLLKGFATSLSIVVSCIISSFLGDLHFSLEFVAGASFILTASFLYGLSSFKGQHVDDEQRDDTPKKLRRINSSPPSQTLKHVFDLLALQRRRTGSASVDAARKGSHESFSLKI